jgi:magnesium-transporting ATPase (P-type)
LHISGSTCKQGEAEGVVISTGGNTFFGRAASLVGQDDDTTGHLQKILAQIGTFCLISIGLFVILYPRFKYSYRHSLDNTLMLLIGGIPIAMSTVLSVTLAVGAQQLAKHNAIVTRSLPLKSWPVSSFDSHFPRSPAPAAKRLALDGVGAISRGTPSAYYPLL